MEPEKNKDRNMEKVIKAERISKFFKKSKRGGGQVNDRDVTH